MRDLTMLTPKQLRTEREEVLFAMMLFFAAPVWLLVLISLVGIPIALFVGLFIVIIQQLFLAYIRGNGVRLSPTQMPEMYARVEAASKRLGLATVPEAYVMQSGGALNAFATKLFSRNFIILYSELIESCQDDDRMLDFIVGHEIGHLALGHLKWRIWLAPAQFTPLLGQAYSRSCEYSCDRAGLVAAGALEPASRGLALLAGGRLVGRKMSLDGFIEQAKDTTGFWTGVVELGSTHPYLSKRVRALKEFVEPGTAPALGRNFFAYPLAPLLGGAAGGGGAAFGGIMFIFAMTGVMAAIAIPNFMKFQAQAKQSEAKVLLNQCKSAQAAFFTEKKRYAADFAELGLAVPQSPTHYTLYMGKSQIGSDAITLPENMRGYSDPEEGYLCVAAANLDEDSTPDIWVIHEGLFGPHHYLDDETDQVHELGPGGQAAPE